MRESDTAFPCTPAAILPEADAFACGAAGERPGLFGRLLDAATAPPLALANSVPGTMVGTGMTPEGINTNPIVYNLYAEMFWRGAVAPDLDTWVVRYYRRRYGLSLKGGGGGGGGAAGRCEAHAARAWGLLQRSVYSAPTMIPGEQGATASDMAARLAVGETVILLHPPSPFSRCFNRDGEGMSAK